MSVINATPLLAAAGGDYQISRSVRLRSSASGYFSRTFSNAATNNLKGSLSIWTKRGTLGAQVDLISCYNGSSSASTDLYFNSSNQLQFDFGNTAANSLITTAVYRDPSAWYHIHLEVDTTQATASNRVKLYVNGVQVTAFGTANYPAQNTVFQIVSVNANNRIGTNWNNSGAFFDGYLTEINFIDGQALTPSSFGETDAVTGVWKPKKYAGTYGTNGFYLNFSDPSAATAAAIGKDYSGNGNNWTPNNISVTAGATYDSMLDVPTLYADGGNGRGNYCVINPLDVSGSGVATLSNANLKATGATSAYRNAFGTLRLTSGSFYFETTVDNFQTDSGIGIKAGSTEYLYLFNGNKTNGTSTAFGSTWTTGDVIGVAFDATNGKVWWSKNGTWQASGDPAAGTNAAFTFTGGQEIVADAYLYGTTSHSYNFGQRPFAYTPPTGFRALNTQNLPEPTIVRGNRFMDATLYTGTGATRSVTNAGGFQPDLVWIKSRAAARSNILFDAVRGIAAGSLYSNTTNAEDTAFTDGLTAYNASGFSLGADSLSRGTNVNTDSYVAWQWREGATQGFDIVTYTGDGGANRAISHGLGVAPAFIVVKNRTTTATNWLIWHKTFSASEYIALNLTSAKNYAGALTTTFGGSSATAPTSSVFYVGSDNSINQNTNNLVAYLFSEVAGFSRFGSYTGNGSADGPFVFCGFRPRWVMIKRSDSNSDWIIKDTARSSYNTMNERIDANGAGAENSYFQIDVTANGFKIRYAGADHNVNGGTYIYAAFAENPFKTSLAR